MTVQNPKIAGMCSVRHRNPLLLVKISSVLQTHCAYPLVGHVFLTHLNMIQVSMLTIKTEILFFSREIPFWPFIQLLRPVEENFPKNEGPPPPSPVLRTPWEKADNFSRYYVRRYSVCKHLIYLLKMWSILKNPIILYYFLYLFI